MANSKQAKKRAVQNEKVRNQNASQKADMRSVMKRFETMLAENNLEEAKQALSAATKRIDKAASKGIIHKNTASRYKSRLRKKWNEANGQPA